MSDVVKGHWEISVNLKGEVSIYIPTLDQHFNFSVNQARALARTVEKNAKRAEAERGKSCEVSQ